MRKNHSFETLSFYRGFSNIKNPSTPLIFNTRKDRVPRDMPSELHESANEWFHNKFGVYYRSQALFVTGSKFMAMNYMKENGFIARILPLGVYKFCWSNRNSDLLFLRTKPQDMTVESYLEGSQYKESDLDLAQASGNEVMLYCEKYIAIPIDLLEEEEIKNKTSIFLL